MPLAPPRRLKLMGKPPWSGSMAKSSILGAPSIPCVSAIIIAKRLRQIIPGLLQYARPANAPS